MTRSKIATELRTPFSKNSLPPSTVIQIDLPAFQNPISSLVPVPVVVALKRSKRARASPSLDLGVVISMVVSATISLLTPVLLSLGLVPDAADFIADGVPDVVYAPQYGHD